MFHQILPRLEGEGFLKHVDFKSTWVLSPYSSFLWRQGTIQLDTRFRGYDGMVGFVLVFGSCSLRSHFAYFRFASRRGVSTIPDGDTKGRED